MTNFYGAFVKEQGVNFAILVVKRHVLSSTIGAERMVSAVQAKLGIPVVLMAQSQSGRPTWYGRKDISKFMSRVPLDAVRWQRITLS